MRHFILTLMLTLAVLLPAPAHAKDKHQKPHKDKHYAASRFEPQHVDIILNYYGGHAGHLPPGLEKQLRRNGQLPPGLQKRVVAFPVVLEQRLPPPPPGCRRVILDSRALLIQDAGNVILDILDLTRRP